MLIYSRIPTLIFDIISHVTNTALIFDIIISHVTNAALIFDIIISHVTNTALIYYIIIFHVTNTAKDFFTFPYSVTRILHRHNCFLKLCLSMTFTLLKCLFVWTKEIIIIYMLHFAFAYWSWFDIIRRRHRLTMIIEKVLDGNSF